MSLLLRHRAFGGSVYTPPLSDDFITEWDMPTGNFTLPLSSQFNYNFTVDWGDGSAIQTVTVYNDANATHNYAVAGTYQIKINGLCQLFTINDSLIKLFLKKVINWGNPGFTSYINMFRGCSNLTEIPPHPLPSNGSVDRIFFGCSNLISVPKNLFLNLTVSSFYASFYNCQALKIIPVDFFKNNILCPSFEATFYNCTGLETVDINIFEYNQNVTKFTSTFYNCSKISTNAPDLWLRSPAPNGQLCFYNNINRSNYSSIPAAWK